MKDLLVYSSWNEDEEDLFGISRPLFIALVLIGSDQGVLQDTTMSLGSQVFGYFHGSGILAKSIGIFYLLFRS